MSMGHEGNVSAPATSMVQQRVSRDAGLAFLAQMVGAALTAALTIFLGRALSAPQFGDFAFALSVITIATLFADLGVTSSSGRFLAERRDAPLAAAGVFRTALGLKLRVGLPASVVLFVAAGPLCAVFGASSAAWALRGCAIALFSQNLFAFFLGAYIALGKLRFNLLLATIESVTEAVASFALVLLGAQASGAAFGRAIGFTCGLGAALVLANRAIGPIWRRVQAADESPVSVRQILGYAGPLLLVDAAFRVFASIDVLLIAALVGAGAQVAAFGLPMRFAMFLDYPAAAVASAIAPRLALRHGSRENLSLFSQSMRYLIIMQMLFTAPLLIWPEAIIHLAFGNKYPEAPAVLRALSPFVWLSGIAQLTTLAVNYLGYARRRVPIAIAMLAVNIAVDVVLLPRIGIVAGAIGTSAAYALWVPAHLWILHRHAGLRLGSLLGTSVRTYLAGAAMVAALAGLGTGQVAAPVMLAGAVIGPVVYVLALVLLRELTTRDIATLRRIVARRNVA
jgi:O-antigen/teichoic acid export membrane protein